MSTQPALIHEPRFDVETTFREQRRHPREIVTKGSAILAGREFRVRNWSPVALLVEECDLDLQSNDTVPLRFSVPLTDHDHNISCDGYILRVDRKSRRVVVMFSGLSKAAQRVVDAHFEQLMHSS